MPFLYPSEQLTGIDDPLKRAFYEIECIRGNWSVRALKRQIASLYFERSGFSKDKEKLCLDDVRDIPTIRMPALAYFLVWPWEEHKQAAKQLGEPATKQIQPSDTDPEIAPPARSYGSTL